MQRKSWRTNCFHSGGVSTQHWVSLLQGSDTLFPSCGNKAVVRKDVRRYQPLKKKRNREMMDGWRGGGVIRKADGNKKGEGGKGGREKHCLGKSLHVSCELFFLAVCWCGDFLFHLHLVRTQACAFEYFSCPLFFLRSPPVSLSLSHTHLQGCWLAVALLIEHETAFNQVMHEKT